MAQNILVVEDEPALQDTLRYNLERAGYQVKVIGDGIQALESARIDPPDLILMDINLPGMSGLEVLRKIRSEPGISAAPVVAMTASASREEITEGIRAGFDTYLTKPFDVRQFMKVINEYLDAAPPGKACN